ncbi:hypothetical protein GGR54DRAFT_644031 [Hypoxylon sp. NC1633]|nr:hypothetical protein GGR54DRAFT_644031 [Hypoxylon sp. NC1633]
MTSIADTVKDLAPRNNELLSILSATDHAAPTLEEQKRYINDLNKELSTVQKHVIALDKQRVKEFKEHKKYRDSVVKRFAYRVGGKTDKFQAKAEKEEHEYFAVLQTEQQAKEQEENIKSMRSKALEVQSDLEVEAARHTEAQHQLDNLYDSIFQGPTPAFPHEDRSEQNAESALQSYHNSRVKVETELRVVHLLTEAWERLQNALNYTEDALSHSRMDMFGGGTLSDMMERNALDKAENQASQMLSLVQQAQRLSQHVHDLPTVGIAHGSLMSDVFFDNIFTDMAFHDKIKDSRSSLHRARENLHDQLVSAKSRHQEAEQEMNVNAAALKTAREELQKAREGFFKRVADGSTGEHPIPAADNPPPY